MKIYDEVIHNILDILPEGRHFPVNITNSVWPDMGSNNIILRSDMAYELGGGTLAAVTGQCLTEDESLVPKNEIILIGPDLCDIKKDAPYARFILCRAKPDSFPDGDSLYTSIRRIEYTKFHIHPAGYFGRISTTNHREPVRISKKSIHQGISFREIGNSYIKKYLTNPELICVKVIFITDPSFDYALLESECLKAEAVTSTLDHVLKDFKMDCSTCNLKDVCDEVEGLRELHFKKSTNNNITEEV